MGKSQKQPKRSENAKNAKGGVRMNISKSKHVNRQQKAPKSGQGPAESLDTAMEAAPLTSTSTSFAELAAAAATQSNTFDENSVHYNDEHSTHTQKDYSHRAYMRELKRVLDLSDVILMVLDARDPHNCRSATIEREIRRREGEGKRLVFVLNKIDLVPKENVEQWLSFLRYQYPTVAFKASTQQQRAHLSQKKGSASGGSAASTADCYGADGLVNLLKNYTRNANLKTSIVCGIIGFPNVGKSSVVNSLKRSKACGVGAVPGFTRVAQEVVLDKNIKIFDSPGVVFADGEDGDGEQEQHEDAAKVRRRQAEIALRNVVKVENVDDVQPAVELILERCTPTHLTQLYDIPAYAGVTDFLVKMALTRGRLGKGGVPDLVGAGRQVLRDYTSGKIPYYTLPPRSSLGGGAGAATIRSKQSSLSSGFYPKEQQNQTQSAQENNNNNTDAAIVSQFGQAFDLAGLMGESDAQALGGAGTADWSIGVKRGREEEGRDVDVQEVDQVEAQQPVHADLRMEDTTTHTSPAHHSIVSLPPKKKRQVATPFSNQNQNQNQHSRLFAPGESEQFAGAHALSRQTQKKIRKMEAKARAKSGALPMSGPGGEGELMKALNGLGVEGMMEGVDEGEDVDISNHSDQENHSDKSEHDEGLDGGRSGYGMSMFSVAQPAPVSAGTAPSAPHAPPQMIDEDEEL
ncbi:hypothetical protein E3P96_01062 [Wallemia ichthyophaga]|nr:hypothetical protein E3P96_01062 [Wallemia ichthyophaga]